MKIGLKFISIMFCLGFFSLPVKSLCPQNEPYKCDDGTCASNPNSCPQKIMKFKKNPGVIYYLPEEAVFKCESGKDPSPQLKSGKPTGNWVCDSKEAPEKLTK